VSRKFVPPSPETVAALRALAERRLTAEEFEAGVSMPLEARERDEALSLIRWFRTRYRTPAERLAYARQAYARWMKHAPKTG
jgi:hypothetical protein